MKPVFTPNLILCHEWERKNTHSTYFLRFSTRPKRAHKMFSSNSDGGELAAPRSRSCGPKLGSDFGKREWKRDANITINYVPPNKIYLSAPLTTPFLKPKNPRLAKKII
jgi:hypothetical protein